MNMICSSWILSLMVGEVVVFHGHFLPGRSGIVFKHNGHSSDAMGDAFGVCHGFFSICSMGNKYLAIISPGNEPPFRKLSFLLDEDKPYLLSVVVHKPLYKNNKPAYKNCRWTSTDPVWHI